MLHIRYADGSHSVTALKTDDMRCGYHADIPRDMWGVGHASLAEHGVVLVQGSPWVVVGFPADQAETQLRWAILRLPLRPMGSDKALAAALYCEALLRENGIRRARNVLAD